MTPTCRSCQRPIRWVKTRNGKSMPVDDKIVTIITQNGDVMKGWQSHFVSCPASEQYRRHRDDQRELERDYQTRKDLFE